MGGGIVRIGTDAVEFVEDQLDRYGLAKTVLAPFGVVGALVTLGVLSGGSTTEVAVRIVVVAIVFVLLVGGTVRNRRLRARLRESRRASLRFANRIIELNGLDYSIAEWREEQEISHAGTVFRKFITIEAGGDRPLELCWHRQHGPEKSEVSKAQKRHVRAEVREVIGPIVDGAPSETGARLDVLTEWANSDLRLIIALSEPLKPGDKRTLYFEITWPEFDQPIERGEVDTWEYKMWRHLELFELRLLCDKDLGLGDRVRMTPFGDIAEVPVQERVGSQLVISVGPWRPPRSAGVEDGMPTLRFGYKIDPR